MMHGIASGAKETTALKTPHVLALCLLTAVVAELILDIGFQPYHFIVAAARVSIVFLSLYLVHRFARNTLQYYQPNLKDLFTLHIVYIGSVALIGMGRFLSMALSEYARTQGHIAHLNPESIHYAIPFAAGALIIQALLGLHFSLVFALSSSLIISIYTPAPSSTIFIPLIFITSLVACLSMARFRSRSAYLKAGLNVTLVSFPFALASFIFAPDLTTADLVVRILGAFIGGALCTLLAAGVTPAFEYLGGYVTDMRLIEIATLDHPLLRELSLQAPGTWNHSMVIGMLAESAAAEINANPVLARVGAYFHDVGKLKKAVYFVENQSGLENRHDKLSTSMSALIIRSHVKDGIELARKHKVPEAVVAMIPQHHGTSLIEYFYNKALKEAQEAGEGTEVDPNLYTYPGPKPQSREAGILMLADKIESASRTLTEPTLDRIQGLVQKMINKVFASGQLDECDLTLSDLHAIAACFTRVLNSLYHQRIAYAEPPEKLSEPSSPNASSAEHSHSETKAEEATREKTTENLKRLGIE